MVLIRSLDRRVTAEAFALSIVVVVDAVAFPCLLALYAEVVVGVSGQNAVAAVGFEYALRHGDARRYTVSLHVGYGDSLVLVYVLFARLTHLRMRYFDYDEREKQRHYCFM